MSPVEQLSDLKSRLADLSKDIEALESLLSVDAAASLNKIRFITESVLFRLCQIEDVHWGDAEPTLERMIGTLTARKIIPKSVATHVRAVQTYSSPGSHFQESALSSAHVGVAQLALIEFLEWYYATYESERGPLVDATGESSPQATSAATGIGPLPGRDKPPAGRLAATAVLIAIMACALLYWTAQRRAERQLQWELAHPVQLIGVGTCATEQDAIAEVQRPHLGPQVRKVYIWARVRNNLYGRIDQVYSYSVRVAGPDSWTWITSAQPLKATSRFDPPWSCLNHTNFSYIQNGDYRYFVRVNQKDVAAGSFSIP